MSRPTPIVQLVEGVVHLSQRTVARVDGRIERLTDREAELLAYLVARPGQDVARQTLLTEVWGYAPTVVSRASDNAIRRLRAKVERDPSQPDHLLTAHGSGYRFEPLVRDQTPELATRRSPLRASDLVGRAGALQAIRAAFDAGALRVALIGPGGIGKTRLAREFWPDAVWIDLIDATDAISVQAAAGAAAGIHELTTSDRLLERIARVIARNGAAVLDNCEQVRDAIGPLVEALQTAGNRVLLTSRTVLDLGETPLALERLSAAAGAELYRRRAAVRARDAVWDPADVDALVAALDGIPLAIELAAARAGVLPPAALLERLDLDVLRQPGARHETMRAAIQGSWDLLEPPEQRALVVLSHLPAGFTDALARRALGAAGARRAIPRLLGASLLRVTESGRLIPFVPVRQFALEQGPTDAERLPLIEALGELGSPASMARIAQRDAAALRQTLIDELPNLAALVPLAVQIAPRAAAQLTLAASQAYQTRGPADLGIRLCDAAIPVAPADTLSALHRARAILLRSVDAVPAALAAIERAQQTAAPGSEDAVQARVTLANLHNDHAQFDRAAALWRTAAVEAQVANRPDIAALVRSRAHFYGDRAIGSALVEGERAVAAAHRTGDLHALAMATSLVGLLCWESNQWDAAQEHYRVAAAAYTDLGLSAQRGNISCHLTQLQLECGADEGIFEEFDLGIRLFRTVGKSTLEALLVATRGMVHAWRGEFDRAEADIASARAMLRGSGVLPEWGAALYDARLCRFRGDLRSAEHAAHEALAGFGGSAHPTHAARARLELARIALAQGDVAAAVGFEAEAAPALADAAEGMVRVELETLRGHIALARSDRHQAEASLERARAIAAASGLTRALAPAAITIAGLARALDA